MREVRTSPVSIPCRCSQLALFHFRVPWDLLEKDWGESTVPHFSAFPLSALRQLEMVGNGEGGGEARERERERGIEEGRMGGGSGQTCADKLPCISTDWCWNRACLEKLTQAGFKRLWLCYALIRWLVQQNHLAAAGWSAWFILGWEQSREGQTRKAAILP